MERGKKAKKFLKQKPPNKQTGIGELVCKNEEKKEKKEKKKRKKSNHRWRFGM